MSLSLLMNSWEWNFKIVPWGLYSAESSWVLVSTTVTGQWKYLIEYQIYTDCSLEA